MEDFKSWISAQQYFENMEEDINWRWSQYNARRNKTLASLHMGFTSGQYWCPWHSSAQLVFTVTAVDWPLILLKHINIIDNALSGTYYLIRTLSASSWPEIWEVCYNPTNVIIKTRLLKILKIQISGSIVFAEAKLNNTLN